MNRLRPNEHACNRPELLSCNGHNSSDSLQAGKLAVYTPALVGVLRTRAPCVSQLVRAAPGADACRPELAVIMESIVSWRLTVGRVKVGAAGEISCPWALVGILGKYEQTAVRRKSQESRR